ncbi:Wzz/FepE/Etk N-terminal domain-containing protein [Sporolactobacillus sp. Y61]|uniref:Wzz/FepE/Etk N-terminal domain-containing protein n=1 Tax=Sporolactobacillus sp. Y61 TaxID=3160863 RepID=A0AAU8IIQ4_9BACL
MNKSLGLKEIFLILKKKIWLIAGITILAGVIAGVYTHYMVPNQYEASTRILVNQTNGKPSTHYDSNAIQANVQLINTYSVIINDPAVLNQVIQNGDLHLTVKQLQEMLTVNTVENSQVFSLTAHANDPAVAVRIVNAVAQEFKSQVQKVMRVDNVSILSPATLAGSRTPVSPNMEMNIVIGLAVGLILSVGLVFLTDYLDNTVRTEEEVNRKLGLPVVGVISKMDKRYLKRYQEPLHNSENHKIRKKGGGHIEVR